VHRSTVMRSCKGSNTILELYFGRKYHVMAGELVGLKIIMQVRAPNSAGRMLYLGPDKTLRLR
jgi:hypothetical protein